MNRHYHERRNRDGSDRNRSTQRVIRLDREKKPYNIAYGYYGDILQVLRDSIATESIDLIYLDLYSRV